MRYLILILILSAIGFASCSSSKGGSTKKARYDRYFLSYTDVLSSTENNAYEFIRNKRSFWLRSNETSQFKNPQSKTAAVYVDGNRWGGVEALRSIPLGQIMNIEYLRPQDATLRFGLDHGGGAILISIKEEK